VLNLPHGRLTAISLPPVIEYNTNGGVGSYLGIAKYLGIEAIDELSAGRILAKAIREFIQRVNLPLSLEQAGVANDAL